MKMKKNIICIICPRGCRLCVEPEGESWKVSGNACPRGKNYGIQEATDPRRMVTAAVPAAAAGVPCATVRSSEPMPIALIPGVLNKLYTLRVSGEWKIGDVLLANYENSGVDIIFTADFPQSC